MTNLPENWQFKDYQEREHREQGVRGGEFKKDAPDVEVVFDLDRGGSINEPYCEELFSAILSGAGIEDKDSMVEVANKLRSGLKTFHSSSVHNVSFFGDISRDRVKVNVNVVEPRANGDKDFMALKVYLTHKGKKVLVFYNFNKKNLKEYLN